MASSHSLRFGLVAAVLLAVLLVSLPGGMDSSFDGAPLSARGRVALSFIFCLAATVYFFPLRRSPGRWLLAGLGAFVVLKIGVSLVSASPKISEDPTYLRAERPKNLLRWDVKVEPGMNGEKAATVEYDFKLEYDRNVAIADFKAVR